MFVDSIAGFFGEFLPSVPTYLGRLALAWVVVFVLLVFAFKALKSRLRPHVLKVDERVRGWALALRYQGQDVFGQERVGLTWFFRFWTNFASSPSLSFWSLIIAVLAYSRYHGGQEPIMGTNAWKLWLLPGLCFSGSMLVSNAMKRVVKRVRPQRLPGAFGHKMKDASFPSGHSLTSFSFWAMLTVTVAMAGFSSASVVLVGLIAATIVGLTGLSRVYLGVHFPSDVLGGFSIGTLWTLASYLVLQDVILG